MEDRPSSTADEERRKIEVHDHKVEKLSGVKCGGEALLEEKEMLERFIGRMGHQELSAGAPRHDERHQSVGVLSGRLHQLTLEEKLFVSREEVAEARKDLEKLIKANEETCDDYKASLKEAEMRLAEIRKAKKDFERKLYKHMNDKRLEMKEPEKCLQYFEDKAKATQVEILRMKNDALVALNKKLKSDFQQKREKGKVSCEEIFQDWSEQKSEISLEELRANSLKVQRVLMVHKEILQNLTSEHKTLHQEVKKKKSVLRKIERELQQSEEGRLKAENLNQHLRRQMANYEVPAVSEYLEARVNSKRLEKDIHTWERKVRIAQMTSKSSATAAAPAPSAEGGAGSAERQIPVKLPPLPEHRWKGRKREPLNVAV